jgi:5-methylcytosine-specific restriction endonuclease McrA
MSVGGSESKPWTIPTSDEQVKFLRNVQRLLAEGLFVASYKFALLHALADLAVLKGDDTGAPLELDTKDIAAKFAELYWRQCRPFQAGGGNSGLVLRQNSGRQAEVVSRIVKAQQECGGSLFRLKQAAPDLWSSLVGEIDRVVRGMPLWKLQTVGDERLDFLYDNTDQGTKVTLKPGVAWCLRAFHELLRDLVRGAWVRRVQKLNASLLGNVSDLGTFLFGQERASLEAYRPVLMAVQKGECLYCRKPLTGNAHIDHFVPWSRYPADLGHNFVAAHVACNHAKSDYLAAEEHLAAWSERNRLNREELDVRLREAELPCDLSASVQVARWAYEQTEMANGQVWVAEKTLRHLGPTWRECVAA